MNSSMELFQNNLTNVQKEILKLHSTNLSDSELIELKEQLSLFYAKKAMDEADKVWEEKGLSNEIMDEWLNEEVTMYNEKVKSFSEEGSIV